MTLQETYRRLRDEGYRARGALVVARQQLREPEFDWRGAGNPWRGKTTRDGFDIVVRVDYDEIGDRDVKWTEREWDLPDRHKSAYRNPNGRLVHDDDTYNGMVWKGYDHRYAYCVPTMQVVELAEYYHDHDGQSRSVALDRAREAVREVVELYNDDTYAEYVIRVTAYRNGIELGSDSLGGVSVSDGSERYELVQLEEVLNDHGMIDNAVSEAQEALAGLCASARPSAKL